jgi:hypothetical protein
MKAAALKAMDARVDKGQCCHALLVFDSHLLLRC